MIRRTIAFEAFMKSGTLILQALSFEGLLEVRLRKVSHYREVLVDLRTPSAKRDSRTLEIRFYRYTKYSCIFPRTYIMGTLYYWATVT